MQVNPGKWHTYVVMVGCRYLLHAAIFVLTARQISVAVLSLGTHVVSYAYDLTDRSLSDGDSFMGSVR